MNYEYNPFEDKKVAEEWINSVENEKDSFRDKEIYPYLEKWVSEARPSSILEIGSGQGICSTRLGDFSGKYIGIEPSAFLVDRAMKLYKNEYRDFIAGSAYKLPIDDQAVDAVLSINVWFHLENLEMAAKELARVLKKDGQFMIITANPESSDMWKSFYFEEVTNGKNIRGKVVVPVNNLSDSTFYDHSLEEILESFKKNNLNINFVEKLGFSEDSKHPLFVVIKGSK